MSATRRLSLPTFNWLRYPGGDEDVPGDEPSPIAPLDEILDAAVAAGFDAVGLDTWTLAGAELDAAALHSRGLECTDVGVLVLGNGHVRADATALAVTAAAAGAEVCIAAFRAPPNAESARELRAAGEILREAGARIALEFAPYTPLRTLEDAIALCAGAGWERCGLLVDSLHFARTGAPWELLRSLAGDQIAHVHVDDAPATAPDDLQFESRFRRLPPGAGELPLADFAHSLAAIGYRGVVSVEVLSTELRRLPPAEGARLLREALLEQWPEGSS